MTYKGYTDPRYVTTAEDLHDRLDEVVLIDVRAGEDYAGGHIEGARHFDLYGLDLNDTAEAPLDAFLWMMETLFGAHGVGNDRPVVFCEHESGYRAARGVWFLDFFGHPDARLLDGGLQAWQAAGMETTASATPGERLEWQGRQRMDRLAQRFDVAAAIGDPNVMLVDTRRESEVRGTEKRARRVGTIPGAVHIEWSRHLDENGAFRPADEVRALYESLGVTPDKTVIPYCHTGYRSASTYLVLRMLGYPNVRNYLGSWEEWGNRDDSTVVIPDEDSTP
jgi:thiosulfate/3-mercaptopyruvate sulfurtransferase